MFVQIWFRSIRWNNVSCSSFSRLGEPTQNKNENYSLKWKHTFGHAMETVMDLMKLPRTVYTWLIRTCFVHLYTWKLSASVSLDFFILNCATIILLLPHMLIFHSQHKERAREKNEKKNTKLLKLVADKTKLFVIAWQQDRINALSQT